MNNAQHIFIKNIKMIQHDLLSKKYDPHVETVCCYYKYKVFIFYELTNFLQDTGQAK